MKKTRVIGAAISFSIASLFDLSGYQTLFMTVLVFAILHFLEILLFYYPEANKANLSHYYDRILPEVTKLNESLRELPRKRVLMPLPDCDFDPTETALAWRILTERYNCEVDFTTEKGEVAQCDPITLKGQGLGFIARLVFDYIIDVRVRQKLVLEAYSQMTKSPNFISPKAWIKAEVKFADYDGVWLTGGHAPGMKQYLSCTFLQRQFSEFWELKRPVAAVCHGVLFVARSRNFKDTSKSLLYLHKTTSLVNYQELLSYYLTFWWTGNLFRTYPETTENEIMRLVYGARTADEARAKNKKMGYYDEGPFVNKKRFTGKNIGKYAYIVEDGHYLSGRWPGDVEVLAHRFGQKIHSGPEIN